MNEQPKLSDAEWALLIDLLQQERISCRSRSITRGLRPSATSCNDAGKWWRPCWKVRRRSAARDRRQNY